jgi:hypothetical protein
MKSYERESLESGDSAAEKRDMPIGCETVETLQSERTPEAMAAQLLDPWIAGDRRRLEFEMEKWRDGTLSLGRTGADDDGRGELLLCLVQQMMGEPDLFAPRSEKMHLGVWVDLLVHLAHPEHAEPSR